MTTLSMVSMRSVSKARTDDYSVKAVTLFSFVGLVGSFCLMMLGVDLGMTASLL